MKALLFHCKNYKSKFHELATRPKNVRPESVSDEMKDQKKRNCIVALVTVEIGDKPETVSKKLSDSIFQMLNEIKRNDVVVVPFAHLSNKLAVSEIGLETVRLVEEELSSRANVLRAHFGSHKDLLLEVYGHPGNVRFREF